VATSGSCPAAVVRAAAAVWGGGLRAAVRRTGRRRPGGSSLRAAVRRTGRQRPGGSGCCPGRRLLSGQRLGLAEAEKKSGSDYHVRGEE
jgi:hypothetical protein